MSTLFLVCWVTAQAAAPAPTAPVSTASTGATATAAAAVPGVRVAVVASDAAAATARVALEGRGFVVEPRDSTVPLVAEAQRVGGSCAVDDAVCWSKVGLYAGFERILVVTPGAAAEPSAIRVVLIDVSSGHVVGEGRADDVTRAIEALFSGPSSSSPPPPPSPPPSPSPAPPPPPSASPAPSPHQAAPLAGEPDLGVEAAAAVAPSLLAITTVSAATIASLCLVSGLVLEIVAVDYLTRLRAGGLAPNEVQKTRQAAVDAERLEIASFVCAGVAGAGAAASGVAWGNE